jgi:putative Holliday junction resolvase
MPEALRLLSFDFGRKRIGIALGNTLTGTASPLETLCCNYPQIPWSSIDELVTSWTPTLFLIGIPVPDEGQTSTLEKPIRAFASQLQKRYDKPVEFVNEAFTSYEAETRLKQQRQQGRKQKLKKHEIDQQAAAIIAETWLENHGST